MWLDTTQAVAVSLHTSDPGPAGDAEVAGGSPAYARQAPTWTTVGDTDVTDDMTFHVPPVIVTHAGVWDASGAFLGACPCTASFDAQGVLQVTLEYNASEETLTADSVRAATYDLVVVIHNDAIHSAPTSLSVSVDGAPADSALDFEVDGHHVWQMSANSEGGIDLASIPLPDLRDPSGDPYFGAGAHTLTVLTSGTTAGTAVFDLQRGPAKSPRTISQDAPPVAVAAADRGDGFYSWVLQDLMPGGLGSYVFPRNPESMGPPPWSRELTHRNSARGARFHIFEGAPRPLEWEFTGRVGAQHEHDDLLAYRVPNRRFYLIDHRNRAWLIAVRGISMVARMREQFNDEMTDWAHDFTVSALVYNPATPITPQ